MNDIEEGNLVIGVQSHIVRNYLMDKISHFYTNHPKIKIQLIDNSTSQLIEKLESRSIDFVIDASPIETIYNNISVSPITELDTCFIKSVGNKNIYSSLDDMQSESLIFPSSRSSLRKNLDKICESKNLILSPKLEFETEELIIDAVRRNLGVGYVVSPAVEYLIKANILSKIEIKQDLPKLEINLVSIDNNLTKIAKLFIKEEILNEK